MRKEVSGLELWFKDQDLAARPFPIIPTGAKSSSRPSFRTDITSPKNTNLETQPLSAGRLPAQALSQAKSRHDLKQLLLLRQGLRD